MRLKITAILLAVVLVLMVRLDAISSYFVWPLGLANEVTVFFGDNRDVAYSVPDSMYREWLTELSSGPGQPCDESCTRTFGIEFKVFGQVMEGEVCPRHGLTMNVDSSPRHYEIPTGLACLTLSTGCLEFVCPTVSRETTLALFGRAPEADW